MDWFVFTYWSIACVVFGAVMAWTRGQESNWFFYGAQALIIAAFWLPILVCTVVWFAGCAIAAPFVRAHTARKQAQRVAAARDIIL